MRRSIVKLIAGATLFGVAVWGGYEWLRPVAEVALTLGEPYEVVRERSREILPPLERGRDWAGLVSQPARFRLFELERGFVTPPAKFLAVTYDNHGLVDGVRLSPQIEPLPLDESLTIVRDLQNQLWRGWTPFRSSDSRPIRDDVATRDAIRNCDDPTSRWNAGDRMQITIDIRCFRTEGHPDRERYLITLVLTRPWITDDRD